MRVAVIGSRNLTVSNLEKYLPKDTTEIVSGGARGIDTCAKEYVLNNNIKITVFLPNYKKYQKRAPLKRNLQIINYADIIIDFWDGASRVTKYVIDNCRKINEKVIVYHTNT